MPDISQTSFGTVQYCFRKPRLCCVSHPGEPCYQDPPPSQEVIDAAKALYAKMVGNA